MICPNCNKEVFDGAQFCDGCGAKLPETVFCPHCGKRTSAGFAFCQNCGGAMASTPAMEQPVEEQPVLAQEPPVFAEEQPIFSEEQPAPVQEPPVFSEEQPAQPAEKRKLPKKAILFGGIGVAVVAVLVLVLVLIFGGNHAQNNCALYMKDNEVFFSDLKKGSEAWQLTSHLVDTDNVDDEDLADSGYMFGRYTYISEDGKYIFFPDKVGDDSDGFNLYYRELAKPYAEPVKVDSGIRYYTVNTSATLVTYLKGNEGNLYQYWIGENSKDKIASDVSGFIASDDGKKIGYINSDKSIYLKYAGKEKEKIAGDIDTLEHITEDFTTAYYIKDGSLYKQVEGADKVKIASNVSDVIKIYDSGELYYLSTESREIPLTDYVTDDMKAADAAIAEPSYPNYPDSPDAPSRPYEWNYDTDEEYDAAYEAYEEAYNAYEEAYEAWEAEKQRMEDEYEASYEAYREKLSRDSLRKDLEEYTYTLSETSLHYYNGKEDIVLSDSCAGKYSSYYAYASETPVIVYYTFTRQEAGKVKLSEIDSYYDVYEVIGDKASTEVSLAYKGNASLIPQSEIATGFSINSSGTVAYFLDNVSDDGHGDLYRVSISNGVVGTPELYDSDVYNGMRFFINDDEFGYFKNFSLDSTYKATGDLYINKASVDYDVLAYNIDYYSGLVYYYTDWNSEKEYGTLKVYNGKDSVKISDDVHSYTYTPDGRVLYLYDYSTKYYKGTLNIWSNGKTEKLDDDVQCIIPIFNPLYKLLLDNLWY